MKMTKNQTSIAEKHNKTFPYSLLEAIKMVKKYKFGKFDESVDLAINLDVDPRHAEENIRVTTPLPHGTGNKVFLTKIKNGWTDVDKIVATPDMMGELGKLGKVLGPKGLMPNPKSGTVTMDVAKAVKELKAGKVELRVESNGIIHVACGKVSFQNEHLIENIKAVYEAVLKARPASVKGHYFKKITVSSTMGPSVLIDHQTL